MQQDFDDKPIEYARGASYTGAMSKKPNPTEYNSPVRIRRRQMRMSQGKLAELAGTDQGQISRVENGQVSLSVALASRLAPHLKTEPAELLFPRNPPENELEYFAPDDAPAELDEEVFDRAVEEAELIVEAMVRAGEFPDGGSKEARRRLFAKIYKRLKDDKRLGRKGFFSD